MLRDRFIYENNKVYYVDHSGKILKIAFSNVMELELGIILQKMVQLQQEKLKLMVKNYTLIILGVFRPKEGLLKTVNSMTKILVN